MEKYILEQLTDIKNKLDKPFPYRDADKIQEDFCPEFLNLTDEEDSLTGDFNTYCMNIAGTLSYVLAGNENEIPRHQIHLLEKSFFERFQQYKFFEDEVGNYKDFFEEYKTFEETRNLLLQALK